MSVSYSFFFPYYFTTQIVEAFAILEILWKFWGGRWRIWDLGGLRAPQAPCGNFWRSGARETCFYNDF